MHLINSTRIGTWKALGEEMRAVADRRYNWAVIARKYNYLINKVSLVARQASKAGLHPRLSQLSKEELVGHGNRLSQRPGQGATRSGRSTPSTRNNSARWYVTMTATESQRNSRQNRPRASRPSRIWRARAP